MKNKIFIPVLFVILGLIALHIPFTRLLGANVSFTLFDFIAPTLGGLLGSGIGILTVFLTQTANVLIFKTPITPAVLVRVVTPLCAVFYFSRKSKINLIIPILAITTFNLHPIGRSAWQFSLLWLIPIAAHFFRRNTYAKSLGATFTAHSVGGAAWVWIFGLSKTMWLALIPQVLMERIAMAAGITVSYFALRWMMKLKWSALFRRSFKLISSE